MNDISCRAENNIISPVCREDFQQAVKRNKYHDVLNPSGVIDLGTAENKLCDDLLLLKLSCIDSKIPETDLHYPCDYGELHLRQTLVGFMKKFLHATVPIKPDNLVLATGLNTSLEQLLFCVTDRGDSVLVPCPAWNKVSKICKDRCEVIMEPVPSAPENDYVPSVDILEEHFKRIVSEGRKVKVLMLINPSNPSGCMLTREQLLDCLKFAKCHDLHVIVDEVYALSVHDTSAEFCSVLSLDSLPDAAHTYVCWGVSKDFGLSGYRLGVTVAWNDKLIQCLKTLSFYGMVPSPVQTDLDRLLKDHEWVESVYLPTYISRLQKACESCQHKLEALDIKVLQPQAGLFIWADLSRFLDDSSFEAETNLVHELLEAGVYIRPGQIFHASQPGFFRVVFSHPPHLMDKGLKRLEDVLKTRTGQTSPECTGATGGDTLSTTAASNTSASARQSLDTDESLEDLVRTLKKSINSSDWLETQQGKWETENPEAAKEYREAMVKEPEDMECKTQ